MKKPGQRGYLREWCILNGLPPELGDAGEADLDRRIGRWVNGAWRRTSERFGGFATTRGGGGGLKALSVRQPWATLIIEYGKVAENRSEHFPKNYEGPLVIASSATGERDRKDVEHTVKRALGKRRLKEFMRRWESFNANQDSDDFPLGKIIGIVDWYKTYYGKEWCPSEWAYNWEGTIQLMLRHPLKLDAPIPAKGRLGLWEPPTEAIKPLQLLMKKWPRQVQEKYRAFLA